MSKQVYIVTVSIDVPVYAESEEEACELGIKHAGEEVDNTEEPELFALPLDMAGGIEQWGNAIPYGDDEYRTIEEIESQPELPLED